MRSPQRHMSATEVASRIGDRDFGSATPFDAVQGLPFWTRAFLGTARRIERGTVEIVLPDGRRFRAAGTAPGPHGRLTVRNPAFFSRLVREGETGFGEMYMDGWWATPDLQTLMDIVLLNNDAVARRFPGAGLLRAYEWLRHRLRANSLRGARRNIARHYDLGNRFYGAWLDAGMTYSSALFLGGEESLEEAQRNKYAAIAARADLRPGDRVLEIGCGWGGFAEFAARECGARVTAITISREQHDFARRRLFEAGLAERASVLLLDYRGATGLYDRIVSIEMIEAVGERYWPAFFASLRDRLRPGGGIALQAITVADRLFPDYRRRSDFMRKHIFPGGMLPSPSALRREARNAGLEMGPSLSLADSYSRTLRSWRTQFNERSQDIAALGFDARFRRMWNFYLAASAACFAARTTDVLQIRFGHAGDRAAMAGSADDTDRQR